MGELAHDADPVAHGLHLLAPGKEFAQKPVPGQTSNSPVKPMHHRDVRGLRDVARIGVEFCCLGILPRAGAGRPEHLPEIQEKS